MTDFAELTDEQLERAMPARLRKRLMQGRFESAEDIAALGRFVGLTQAEFARAIAISVHSCATGSRAEGRKDPQSRSCESPRGIRGSFESGGRGLSGGAVVGSENLIHLENVEVSGGTRLT